MSGSTIGTDRDDRIAIVIEALKNLRDNTELKRLRLAVRQDTLDEDRRLRRVIMACTLLLKEEYGI